VAPFGGHSPFFFSFWPFAPFPLVHLFFSFLTLHFWWSTIVPLGKRGTIPPLPPISSLLRISHGPQDGHLNGNKVSLRIPSMGLAQRDAPIVPILNPFFFSFSSLSTWCPNSFNLEFPPLSFYIFHRFYCVYEHYFFFYYFCAFHFFVSYFSSFFISSYSYYWFFILFFYYFFHFLF
jgi:hypothetical protein